MKYLAIILLLCCFGLKSSAQVDTVKKPSTLVFHVFYNDFKTTQLIRTTSLQNVLGNHLWSSLGDMQMGLGFNYLKGLTRNIDLVGTLDGSYTDYLFKDGSSNGSSQFLLDANAGFNLKMLNDRHTITPYLFVGGGFSLYQGKTGFYLPAGFGLQFNLFHQAFVFTNMQYRYALTPQVNDHFQYNIGVGASIGKRKKAAPAAIPVVPIKTPDPVAPPVIVKVVVKNMIISVTDEQTSLALPNAEVTLSGPNGKTSAFTDANGQVSFNNLTAADYTVSGTLHGVATSTQSVAKNGFDIAGSEIKLNLTQNDPRFTLAGRVVNKTSSQPESDVTVNVANITQNSTVSAQSKIDGSFDLPLEPGSDFSVLGKKANYISNIEKLSTKGLNRSVTLFVKLELAIEEAAPNKTITLSNIYYDSGSYKIRPGASTDLEKLVQFLKDNPNLRIEIDSHTDSRGSAASNMRLSQNRSQAVVNYLQKNGIGLNRLVAKGYGATRLVNGCTVGVKCTEAQHEQNRRTEFKVIGS